MKILFVSGNQEQLPDAVIPLGLLYVMANTPERHEKIFLDLCFAPDANAALTDAVRTNRPDLIAISMRNIQNNDYTGLSDNLDYYGGLVSTCKKISSTPVVLGGAGFSIMPKELMVRLKADFGISGEGEEAFPKLLDAIELGSGLSNVPGLYRLDADSVTPLVNANQGFLDMTALNMPDRSVLDTRYFDEYGIDSVQTKRGCPLRCDYCTYPIIEGRKGRLRTPESVVDEMLASAEANPSIKHFFIVDSVFNLPKTHAKKVCRELIARDWSIPWTCYANPLGFDAEFAELAAEAGCAGMEVGSDSGVDRVLERLRKGFTVDHIRKMNEICRAAGIRDCHTFILGTQGETLDDSQQTLDFLTELDPFAAIIMVWTDDYESLQPDLRKDRLALRAQIEQLLVEQASSHPTWSMPGLGINFSEHLFTKLRGAGMHGPLWQHVRGPLQPARSRTIPRSAERLLRNR